jgi:hypothetical protein
VRIVFALFLAAHGLIHLSYLSPAPAAKPGAPSWPFEMSRSWLVTAMNVDPGVVRAIGSVMVIVAAAAFVLAGLSWLGLVVPRDWWPMLIGVGAVASLAVLVVFFHPWILLGFAIDAVLLWLAFVAGWMPEPAGT